MSIFLNKKVNMQGGIKIAFSKIVKNDLLFTELFMNPVNLIFYI